MNRIFRTGSLNIDLSRIVAITDVGLKGITEMGAPPLMSFDIYVTDSHQVIQQNEFMLPEDYKFDEAHNMTIGLAYSIALPNGAMLPIALSQPGEMAKTVGVIRFQTQVNELMTAWQEWLDFNQSNS